MERRDIQHEENIRGLESSPERTLSSVEARVTELFDKMMSRAAALIKAYPHKKEAIEASLHKARTRMTLILGAAVLSVASSSAFAEEQKGEELAQDTVATTTVTGAMDTAPEEQVLKPKKAPIASIEDALRSAFINCAQAESAAVCAENLLQAVVVNRQESVIDALSILKEAKSPKERVDALELLVKQLPFLGTKLAETAKNKVPLLDLLQVLPQENGDASDAAKKLLEKIETVKSDESSLKERSEAALGIATDTPVVNRVLYKINPIIAIIKGVAEIKKEVSLPHPDLSKIAILVGKMALNRITFGLGDILERGVGAIKEYAESQSRSSKQLALAETETSQSN